MPLYKKDIVKIVAEAQGLSEAQVDRVMTGILEAIQDNINPTQKVILTGFGTFSVTAKAAREGHNPGTGEKIQIAAKNAPKFTAGADLKAKVA